ncbi:hypothetical protein LCGC14_0094970 [marine sediment metagenome]|uniref:Short-chain dehydrogenase/reductase SDR n=1 Tax=marine sediment metagenome TaxID=412755 RepID=A0A0F9VHM0_9ZZZZ|nr:SDR family oxidoreductase [Phycisphaerae bacterium]
MELHGKIAVVTGAARRLGRAIATGLADAGADVAVHYHRSARAADETVQAVRRAGGRSEAFQADLADPADIERLFEAIAQTFSHVDVLVNSAATYNRTPIDSLTAAQWDAELAVNARAPALCIRYALPLMPDGGAIVNITDIAAERTWPGFPAYCASKAALAALTGSSAKALAGRKICVNAVAPGAILWQDDCTEQQKQNVLKQVPLPRAGTPEDIAAAVVFLVRNDYITGQTLRVDGGWCMR